MRRAMLHNPYKGYSEILVDEDSISGAWHGYQYTCIVEMSGAVIDCYRDEFEFID